MKLDPAYKDMVVVSSDGVHFKAHRCQMAGVSARVIGYALKADGLGGKAQSTVRVEVHSRELKIIMMILDQEPRADIFMAMGYCNMRALMDALQYLQIEDDVVLTTLLQYLHLDMGSLMWSANEMEAAAELELLESWPTKYSSVMNVLVACEIRGDQHLAWRTAAKFLTRFASPAGAAERLRTFLRGLAKDTSLQQWVTRTLRLLVNATELAYIAPDMFKLTGKDYMEAVASVADDDTAMEMWQYTFGENAKEHMELFDGLFANKESFTIRRSTVRTLIAADRETKKRKFDELVSRVPDSLKELTYKFPIMFT